MSDDEEFPAHLLPESLCRPDAPHEAVLAWECQRCGKWIREYGPSNRGTCRPADRHERPEAS